MFAVVAETMERGVGSPPFTPVGRLQFPLENTKGYMSGMSNIVVPFCCCNEPSSSPFEMQNL